MRRKSVPGRGFKYLPVELFRIGARHFAFDASNVLFMEVDRPTFDILRLLRRENLSASELAVRLPQHAAKDLRNACRELAGLRKQGYLNPHKLVRAPQYSEQEVLSTLARKLSGLTVFLTTRCNLACSYCMYGSGYPQHRVPAGATMTRATADNMLDFLHRHSDEAERIQLVFYGGEPLLAFPLMRYSVDRWKAISGPKAGKTDFLLITNGTLLRGDRLDFLIRNRIHVQISLDGDAVTHDMARRYRKNGRGSFEDIFSNLVALYARDPEYVRGFVHLKGVLTAGNAVTDDGSFYRHPVIAAIKQAGHLDRIEERPPVDPDRDAASPLPIREIGKKLLRVRGARRLADLGAVLDEKERQIFEWTYANFYRVQAINKALFRRRFEVPFLRSCMPGFQDGAVLPNGDIAVCAEATSHIIGNVNEGRWYDDRIAEMHFRLHSDWGPCSECFTGRFCNLCWQKVAGDGDAWRAGRTRFCVSRRKHFREIFGVMLRVLVRNPDLWEDLDRTVRETIAAIRKGLVSPSFPAQ